MIRQLTALAAGIAAIASASALAQDLAFVTCPIIKDTPSVPCWLAEYGGELYYMGVQSDVSAPFSPPWLGHEALVEGTPSPTGERICGGVVLEPVKVSVMPEMAPECDTMLPAEPGYVLPFEPRRPPGPSNGRLAFTPPEPPPAPQPPFEARSFPIYFPFEGSVNFQTPGVLREIQDYAEAIGATRIRVTGHRAAVRLTGGEVLEEREGLAEKRAREVSAMFRGLIPTVTSVETVVQDEAQIGDHTARRVDVVVVP